jgi:hypothetical protein
VLCLWEPTAELCRLVAGMRNIFWACIKQFIRNHTVINRHKHFQNIIKTLRETESKSCKILTFMILYVNIKFGIKRWEDDIKIDLKGTGTDLR